MNDWQKERQFKALNERKEERGVKVIRDGIEKVIDIKVCTPFYIDRAYAAEFLLNVGCGCRRYRACRTW